MVIAVTLHIKAALQHCDRLVRVAGTVRFSGPALYPYNTGPLVPHAPTGHRVCVWKSATAGRGRRGAAYDAPMATRGPRGRRAGADVRPGARGLARRGPSRRRAVARGSR